MATIIPQPDQLGRFRSRSIGVYSTDAYDGHQISGLHSVVVIELKRSSVPISGAEKDQAMNYARKMRNPSQVNRSKTKILVYVLGGQVDEDIADENGVADANPRVIPLDYDTVLRTAHARTFNLLRMIEKSNSVCVTDPELEEVLHQSQTDLFA